MIDEKLEKSAIAKGLTIEKANKGFSVKKEGVQIRFCFNEDSLSSFLSDTGDDLVFGDKLVEKNTGNHVIDKVVTKTVVEIREVVITDINMPFSSMVSFAIKWSIASIPALILMAIIYSVAVYLFGRLVSVS